MLIFQMSNAEKAKRLGESVPLSALIKVAIIEDFLVPKLDSSANLCSMTKASDTNIIM